MGGLSWVHWLVVIIVVLLVFGTKRLVGGARDLGKAVNEFKKGLREGDDAPEKLTHESASQTATAAQEDSKQNTPSS